MAKTEAQSDLRVDQIAGIIYSMIDGYNTIVDDAEPRPRWDDADEQIQAATIQSIVDLRDSAPNTPSENHELWVEVMTRNGWTLGGTLDPRLKKHPNLVPFMELPLPARKFMVAMHQAARTMLE